MKTISTFVFSTALATGLILRAAEAPPPAATPAQPPTPPAITNAVVTEPVAPATNTLVPAVLNSTNAPGDTGASTNGVSVQPTSSVVVITNPAALPSAPYNPQDGLRLNFRGVPLELVLNYLSDAAGFIIVLETKVEGKVDVWSNQPLSKDEAVSLLNSVLNKNGYAAIRNGRTLTVVARDSAKTRDIPVKRGSDPNEIPKNDEIITQIIPVKYINAAQLTKDLQPLLPLQATMTANEAGNSLVITDSQANIRRVAEIIKALDTSFSSVSSIRVYLLKFADAKTVATVVRDLFQGQDSGRGGQDMRNQFFQRMRFGGGGPGGGGPGGGEGPVGAPGSGRAPTPKVVATSDERSNALVVSAPDEVVPTIDDLVKAIDAEVEDVTEVRVFRLKYADPGEMADLLAGLFPDDTRSDGFGRVRFGGMGGRFGGFPGANSQSAQTSDRMKRMGRVIAVPDQRTASVVVSAARDMMTQITEMVEQLDSNPAKKQKVYVYSLENADVTEVEQLLRDMFDRTGTMNSRNTANQRNALNSRSQQNSQNPNRSSGIGNQGMGGRGGTGGMGGGIGTGF